MFLLRTPKKDEIDKFNAVKLLYERASNDWRHFDDHIWQIPSLAITINLFLVSQAFSKDLVLSNNMFTKPCLHNCIIDPFRIIRVLIIFLATCLTFVLTIALAKHRLHELAKSKNLEEFENHFPIKTKIYDFANDDDFNQVIVYPHFVDKVFRNMKAHRIFIYLMCFTIIIDIILIFAISFLGW